MACSDFAPFLCHLMCNKTDRIRKISEQECIPVGCIPSAAVAVSGGGWGVGGEVVCLRGVWPGGVCLWGSLSNWVSAWGGVFVFGGGYLSNGGVCPGGVCLGGEHPTPVDRMTDACENTTFPQLLLRTVNIISGRILAFYLFRVYSEFQICLLKEKHRKKN